MLPLWEEVGELLVNCNISGTKGQSSVFYIDIFILLL